MPNHHRRAAVPALLAVFLASCGGQGDPDKAPTAAVSASAVASSMSPAVVGSSRLPGDQVDTERYKIDISYPELAASAAPLADALHAYSRHSKRELMHSLPDAGAAPDGMPRQRFLGLHFSIVSRLPTLVSVRGQGDLYSGGAHPLPLETSLVYDTRSNALLGIEDLFAEPAAALDALSAYVRQALLQQMQADAPDRDEASPQARRQWLDNMQAMIASGTAPEAQNFSEFVVLAGADEHASGLMLIFPPYQVMPYVYGTQTVTVPTAVFAPWLKPAYREVFSD